MESVLVELLQAVELLDIVVPNVVALELANWEEVEHDVVVEVEFPNGLALVFGGMFMLKVDTTGVRVGTTVPLVDGVLLEIVPAATPRITITIITMIMVPSNRVEIPATLLSRLLRFKVQ